MAKKMIQMISPSGNTVMIDPSDITSIAGDDEKPEVKTKIVFKGGYVDVNYDVADIVLAIQAALGGLEVTVVSDEN